MVIGAVWCPVEKTKEIAGRLGEIKAKHGMPPDFEVKWTKVSHSKWRMYMEFVDYFFDDDHLHFRGLIAPKGSLNHREFNQVHDDWYYKMYFDMLKVLLDPESHYRIYLDIKDTRGAVKVRRLQEVLCNNMYDFQRSVVERMQLVRSNESQLLQLADLLLGAVSYLNRGLSENAGKRLIVDRIKERSKYSLTKTTLYREEKMNLLRWQPAETCG
jgi:hypothetical protein